MNQVEISVKIIKPGIVIVATVGPVEPLVAAGWKMTDMTFNYNDRGRAKLLVLSKAFAEAGVVESIPQIHWSGTIVIFDQ